MVNIDGMIRRLMQLVKNSDKASALCGSRKHSQPELFLIHGLRTTEGKQDAARFDFLKRFCIESGITFECISQDIFMFGKRRGIKYDKIIIAVHILQILECIFGIRFMMFDIGEIKCHIRICNFDGAFRTVH